VNLEIEIITENIACRDDLKEENLRQAVENYLNLLKKPQKFYSIRLNLSENSYLNFKDNQLCELSNLIIYDPKIPNIGYLKSQGPYKIKKLQNSVTIDRFAAESVMIGANLYVPGFLPQKNVYKFKKGDQVSIYGPGNTHIGNGIIRIDAKELNEIEKGIGILTTDSLYNLPSYRESEYFNSGLISDMGFGPLIACWTIMSKYSEGGAILDLCSAPGHKTCALSEIGYYLRNF